MGRYRFENAKERILGIEEESNNSSYLNFRESIGYMW